jgi:hypothetical protein
MVRSYDLEFRLARARKLERALRNKGWTRKQLAEETGYDEKRSEIFSPANRFAIRRS